MIDRQPLLVPMAVAALAIAADAQEPEPLRWTLEAFQTRCIPLRANDPTIETEDCKVAEFGEFAELDGWTFYYARYHDRGAPVPNWGTGAPVKEFNALVAMGVDPVDRDQATVFHVRKYEDYGGYPSVIFAAPVLLQTGRGPILYLQGFGPGALQFEYDQYWLWQFGTWVALDTDGWLKDISEQMPDGFYLYGVGDLRTALSTLTYVRAARREEDAMCCATGGTLTIRFEWDDLTLRVASFEHDPEGRLTE